MKFSHLNLRMRFILPTLAGLIFVMGGVGHLEIRNSAASAKQVLEGKAATLTTFFQKAGANYISNFDFMALEKFVQVAKEDEDVSFVVFMDDKGKALTNTNKLPQDLAPFFISEKDIFTEGTTNKIGKVIVGYDQSAMDKAQRKAALTSLLAILIGVSLVGLIVFKISGAVTEELSQIASQVESSTAGVNEATQQLSQTSGELSNGATEAASSLQETGAAIEELTSMVVLNAEHAKEASNLSSQNREAAQRGEAELGQLISAMGSISESSKKIEDIINVIDDIAFQTNLLALNAAVEAARAGEQGKSFAVVAEAVRNLAQRSAVATKDIANLIKDSSSRVNHGAAIADRSNKVLHEMVESVLKVADLNVKISNASHEQATGIEQINKAISMLDQSTQRNAASAKEVSKSSLQMSDQAKIFDGLVRKMSAIVYGAKKAKV